MFDLRSISPTWLQWRFLNSFANNEVARIVVVVLIAGYLILFKDGVAELLSFDRLAGISSSDYSPFVIDNVNKLRLAFFGSIFVFVANMIC